MFCALASPASSAPPEPRAVTVGIPQSFPPYYGLDEDGNPVGFAVDLMDEVAERAGFEVSYSVVKTGGDNFEALLDLAVGAFVASPDYRRIYVAWFGEPTPFWTLTRAAWTMGVLFALSLIAMAGWRYRTIIGLTRTLKNTINERRRAEETMRDYRDRNRRVADSIPAAITYFDKEQQYQFVNRLAQEWFAHDTGDHRSGGSRSA
jgi:ABC-type amino acid transport substrate-binding protein